MIPIEVRKKIVAERKAGVTIVKLSKRYKTSKSSIDRLLRQERETGSIEPRTHQRGRKPTLDANRLEELRNLILSKPHITLEEIKEEMELSIVKSTIGLIVSGKLGFPYKKRKCMPVNGTGQVQQKVP